MTEILASPIADALDNIQELSVEVEMCQAKIHIVRNANPFNHKDLLHEIDKWSKAERKLTEAWRKFQEII